MQKNGLIIDTPEKTIWVEKGQTIGTVGATGNVWPQGVQGAHIHFGVVYDKNHDGNFNDNIPDGMIDPFGWQSKEQDPWKIYSFFLNDDEKSHNISRIGSKSYYLWTNELLKSATTLGKNGGLFGFTNSRYSINFPEGAVSQDLIISLSVEQVMYEKSAELRPIGAGLVITATDLLGNIISSFMKNFTIHMIYKGLNTKDVDTESIALYSSQDGINWHKELTTAHDTTNNILSAQLNHLTHFVLMAERKDTVSPTTQSILTGDKYTDTIYQSSVVVSLIPKDNEGGLGIDYTLFKDETNDWDTYTTPLTYTDEGHHIIEYYSVDKAWNSEKMQTISFDIVYEIPPFTPTPTAIPTIIQPDILTPTQTPPYILTPTPIIFFSSSSLAFPSPTITNNNSVSTETLSSTDDISPNLVFNQIKPTSIITKKHTNIQNTPSSSGTVLGIEKASAVNSNKKKGDERWWFFLFGLCVICIAAVSVQKRRNKIVKLIDGEE